MEYSKLADLYERLEKEPAKLKKTEYIANFIAQTPSSILPAVIMLIQGKLFPQWYEKEIGVASKMMVKAIALSTGFSEAYIMERFAKLGDLGLVAEELIKNKKQVTLFQKPLTIELVYTNLRKLAEIEGAGAQDRKMNIVKELIAFAKPKEARYVVRTVLEELRIGVAEGIVRDAIAKAYFCDILWFDASMNNPRITELIKSCSNAVFIFEKGTKEKLLARGKVSKDEFERFERNNKVSEKSLEEIKGMNVWKKACGVDYIILMDERLGNELKANILGAIEWAWFLRPDYGDITLVAKEKGIEGLKNIKIEVGKPVYVLLAEKAPSLQEALQEYEHAAIEFKYDGMRTQIHKKGNKVMLFTRRLENVTNAFPDLVELVKNNIKAEECVIEGETIGIDPQTSKPLPFQYLSQRIHRKYDIHRLIKEIPIQVNLFDIIYLNGEMLFNKPFRERRKILESITNIIPGQFQLAEQLITKDLKEAEAFYKKALEMGQEGVMVKNLDAIYQPGKRVAGGWLKVKPVMETLDLAITGALWGTGKRSGWFGSFILACRDQNTGKFLECGMLGTGIKEKKTNKEDITFKDLTEMLKPYVELEKGNEVKIRPKIVIEVAYEEIQRSPNYSSGYALRFPRLIRVRWDKDVTEIDTLERIKYLFSMQRGRESPTKR